jgi:hypothetical protein
MEAFEVHSVPLKCFGNLDRQFASWHQHQRLRQVLL